MKKLFSACFIFACLILMSGGIAVSSDKVLLDDSPDCEIVVEISGSSIASFRNISSSASDAGMSVMENSPYSADSGIMLVKTRTADADKTIKALEKLPGVVHAEKNCIYRAFKAPNDPKYRYQWNLKKINMDRAWRLSTGKGVKVAVIDTGIAYGNSGRFVRLEDFDRASFADPFNFITNTTDAFDDNGHGSHVAGTIAQSTNNSKGVAGIAFNAVLMPVKVLDENGNGSLADIAEGVKYAAAHGAKVINLSLGGPTGSRILENACRYARSKGCVIVCAAGNDGSESPNYPAAYESCISVSAVRYDNKLAPYSSRGKYIDIAAPGGDMGVDQNKDGCPDGIMQNTIKRGHPEEQEYALYQGTSMAAPHVAGTAALMMAAGIKNPADVEAALKETAFKRGLKLGEGYGAGILDAGAAVAKARSLSGGASSFGIPEGFPNPLFPFIAAVLSIFAIRRFSGNAKHIEEYTSSLPFVAGIAAGAYAMSLIPLSLMPDLAASAVLCAALPISLMFVSIPFRGIRRFSSGFAVGFASLLASSVFDGGSRISAFADLSGFNCVWIAANASIAFISAAFFIRFSPEK